MSSSVTRSATSSDSIAQVAAPGLLSAITVNIEAGKSPTALAPGERVKGQAAANLFAMMHALDAARATAIAVMAVPEIGLGRAINDRLRRAAQA